MSGYSHEGSTYFCQIVAPVVCWYCDLPNAILWGTIVGLLNFLPYLGPLTSLALLTTAQNGAINLENQ